MSRLSKAVRMGLLTALLGLGASVAPLGLDLEEDVGLRILFSLRGVRQAPPDVLIVSMDKDSSDNLNLPTDPDKWPRSLHASLTENLAKSGAAVIAFDIIFDESSSDAEDNRFAEAIRSAGNVVLCEYLKKETVPLTDAGEEQTGNLHVETLHPPIESLARCAAALAPFPLPKVPVKVSQCWNFKEGAGDTPTLPVVAFQIFALQVYDDLVHLLDEVNPSRATKLPPDRVALTTLTGVENFICILRDIFQEDPRVAHRMLEELQKSTERHHGLGRRHILKSLIKMYQRPSSRYLNFYGPPGTITTVPYYQLVQHGQPPTAAQEQVDLSDKAVFIGLSEHLRPEQKDGFHTVFSQPTGVDVSGVEIAATAFGNILEDMPVQPLCPWLHLATILCWGTLLCVVCRYLSTLVAAIAVLGMSILYLLIARNAFASTGCWNPVVVPLFFQAPFAFFGTTLWMYFETREERQNIRKAFGYYLPNKVVDQLAVNVGDVKASGQLVHGTCMCTDAEQYSTLSEIMHPEELSAFMNKYYEAVFEPVGRHGGLVSDVVGDSMLAVWAVTEVDTSLKSRACLAALEVSSAVQRFNERSGDFELPTRMGLHSGPIVLGNIGAIYHYEYRAVGDIVNTAARIEGLNKYLGTRILVSADVLDQVEGFLTRELGEFLLVGKSRSVVVHELICRTEECDSTQRRLCSTFNAVLSAYRRQSWEEAIELCHEARKIYGEDGPTLFYLQLCKGYMENPPGATWNQIVHMDRK